MPFLASKPAHLQNRSRWSSRKSGAPFDNFSRGDFSRACFWVWGCLGWPGGAPRAISRCPRKRLFLFRFLRALGPFSCFSSIFRGFSAYRVCGGIPTCAICDKTAPNHAEHTGHGAIAAQGHTSCDLKGAAPPVERFKSYPGASGA